MNLTGKKHIIFVMIFAGMLQTCCLGEVIFKASVDRAEVPLDEIVSYTLSLNSQANNVPSPVLPRFDGLTPISSSQSSNMSIINGQVNSSVSFSYACKPQRIGKATIGSASINIDGKTYSTEPITVNIVSPSGKRASVSSPARSAAVPAIDEWDDFFNNFFTGRRMAAPVMMSIPKNVTQAEPLMARTSVSRTDPYINEQVTLTFTFYRRVNLMQSPNYTPANTIGFWSVNLPVSSSTRQVNIKGVPYLAQDLHTAIFPTKSGRIKIGSALLSAVIDPFSPPYTIKTDELFLNAKPLPEEGKPVSFSGAVGKYAMSAAADKSAVERGKPVTLTVKISGTGNIQTINEPLLKMGSQLKKLGVNSSQTINKSYTGISGSKTFEIIIMPVQEGPASIESVNFSFFDPSKSKYTELTFGPVNLNVLASSIPLPKELIPQKPQQSGLSINLDFRRIAKRIFNFMFNLYSFIVLILISLVYAAVKSYDNYIKHLKEHPEKFNVKNASRSAKRTLRKASRLLRSGEPKGCVDEVYIALAKYLGDKFSFSAQGITEQDLKEMLNIRGVPAEILKEIEDLINECDMIKFTPSGLDRKTAASLLNSAADLIIRIDSKTRT